MKFKLVHQEGKLIASIDIEDNTYQTDVTDFFEESDVFTEWLEYKRKRIAQLEQELNPLELETTSFDTSDELVSVLQYNAELREKIVECYTGIHGVEPSVKDVLKITKNLPPNIHYLVKQWGWNDTEVRDDIYRTVEATVVHPNQCD